MEQEIAGLTKEIEIILRDQSLDWTPMHMPPPESSAYQAAYKDWSFIVVDFCIADQGFPTGSRGYDGTAWDKTRGIILHITRDLAKLAFEKAKEQHEHNPSPEPK